MPPKPGKILTSPPSGPPCPPRGGWGPELNSPPPLLMCTPEACRPLAGLCDRAGRGHVGAVGGRVGAPCAATHCALPAPCACAFAVGLCKCVDTRGGR